MLIKNIMPKNKSEKARLKAERKMERREKRKNKKELRKEEEALKNISNKKVIDGLDIICDVSETKDLPVDCIIGKDINIQIGGKRIVEKGEIKITQKNRYGLLGPNGSGKSTLLKCIYNRLIPSNKNLKIIQVEQTFITSKKSVYQTLLETNEELFKLKTKMDEFESRELEENEMDEYMETSEKLEELDFDKNDSEIRKILHGLGFTPDQMEKPTESFSGGWQRRIALGKVLYLNSDVVLLDEPTNHLDLEAVIWLSNYLSESDKILIIVSHSADFLDIVCNQTLFLINNKIRQYKGGYSRAKYYLMKDEGSLEKKYKELDRKLREMSSKHKTKKEKEEYVKKLDLPLRMPRYDVIYPKYKCMEIKGNLVKLENVSFSYTEEKLLENINLELKMGRRYTLVGKNGAGKSTLIRILNNELKCNGDIVYNGALKVGVYNQHFDTLLPEEETPVSYLMEFMSDDMSLGGNHMKSIRQYLGMIKLEGKAHLQKMGTLSGGQKARVAWLAMILQQPHLILLDEPTNHMDLEGIEGMIKSLENFNGSLVIVTHDPTLITKLETELLVLENNTINSWKGDYDDYMERILLEE